MTDAGTAVAGTERSRGVRPGDRVRAAAPVFRFGLAVALVAASPLVPGAANDQQVRFGLLVAIVWIPVAGVVAMVARRRTSRTVDLVSFVVDASLLVLLHVVLHPLPIVAATGSVVLVALYAYLRGAWFAVLPAALGWVLIAAEADNRDARFSLVLYPFVTAAMAFLLATAATERWRASAGLVRLHEKSDAILTGVAEAVVVTTPRGRIGQWNRAAERTFGCPAADARNRNCTEMLGLRMDVRDLDCAHGCALLEEIPEGGDVEVWRAGPTGVRQPLLATAVPVLDADGGVVEVVHSFRDITRLKQADEAKTLFLATASHELKTPLTVIRGFSQMLLLPNAQMDAGQRASALRAIDVRAGQLTGIVDRLLMSSRIEAGRIDLTPEAVDLAPLLAERVDALRAATGREVDLRIGMELPAPWADLDATTTIVDHLLDNAVKYSPNGGPITVTLCESANDPGHVQLQVSDEGVGMTEEHAQHCFDRFWQAEPTDVRRFGGTGIGLYIVRSLVEGQQGTVNVTSAPGEGSTFCVSFWRADCRTEPAVEAEVDDRDRGRGDPSIIREYMRQLGVKVEAGS